MKSLRLHKVCALLAATLILPALAYAGQNNQGGNNQGGNNQGGNNQGGMPLLPEANAAWVLVPFLGAVLLFSSRRLFRGKVGE